MLGLGIKASGTIRDGIQLYLTVKTTVFTVPKGASMVTLLDTYIQAKRSS